MPRRCVSRKAAAALSLSRADKANATGLYVTDKNVRAIDNNYYTPAKETEARVRPRRAG